MIGAVKCFFQELQFYRCFMVICGRAICLKKLPDSWFVGIPDRYVNVLARMHAAAEREGGDVAGICRAACRERNRRYPGRVGLPRSMAVRWK